MDTSGDDLRLLEKREEQRDERAQADHQPLGRLTSLLAKPFATMTYTGICFALTLHVSTLALMCPVSHSHSHPLVPSQPLGCLTSNICYHLVRRTLCIAH